MLMVIVTVIAFAWAAACRAGSGGRGSQTGFVPRLCPRVHPFHNARYCVSTDGSVGATLCQNLPALVLPRIMYSACAPVLGLWDDDKLSHRWRHRFGAIERARA